MSQETRQSVIYSQNFLKSRKLARRLIERSSIVETDTVVEVGPGRGMLTRLLADRCRHVIAVEKDPELARELVDRLGDAGNVTVFGDDFLTLPLPLTQYKVIANIPFNITADIVRKFTCSENPPDEMFLVMQKEAAGRFMGVPATSLFSLLLHPWFELSISHVFRATDFVPPPRVQVVMLRFSKRGPPLLDGGLNQLYRDFVTFGFTAWQPDVGHALEPVFGRQLLRIARKSGVDLQMKPRELSPEQWLALHDVFVTNGSLKGRELIAGSEERLLRQQDRLHKSNRTRARGQ